jgi:hypothetical protein
MRFDWIIVAILSLVITASAVYVIDHAFAESYNEKFHTYDSHWRAIEEAMRTGDFDHVVSQANSVLATSGPGANEIRATSYVGLARLKQDDLQQAKSRMQYLITKYPPLQAVYGEQFNAANDSDDLASIYRSILSDFIPGMHEVISNKTTTGEIIDAMDLRHWISLLGIMIGSVIAYERVRRKMAQPE